MTTLVARAPAKVNLTFEVVGEMPYGYHEVSTLMQAVDLEDELSFELEPSTTTEISIALSNDSFTNGFPLGDTNLIARAIKEFVACLPERGGLRASVAVDKRIPIGAGLGGGSSDAAATLLTLNYYFGYPLGTEDLLALGARLGADVPFMIEGGTKIGRGRGDELSAVHATGNLFFVLAKPRDLAISTAWVYSAYDDFPEPEKSKVWSPPDLVGAINGLTGGDLELAASCFGNDLEPVVFHNHPQLASIKENLLSLGCWCCHLTGSGPTLFGVVAGREMAHAVRRRFLGAPDGEPDPDLPEHSAENLAFEVDFWIAECVGYGARLIGDKAR